VSKRAWWLLSGAFVTFLLLLGMLDLAFITTQIPRTSDRDAAAIQTAVRRVRADLVAMESAVDRITLSGDKEGRDEYNRASALLSKDSRVIEVIASHMNLVSQDAAKNVFDTAQLIAHTDLTISRAGRAVNTRVARETARQLKKDIARFDSANDQLTADMFGESAMVTVGVAALIASVVFSVVLALLLIMAARSRRPVGIPNAAVR
jgi:hypothetical protein